MLWRSSILQWVKGSFLREEKVSVTKRDQVVQQEAELKKALQISSYFVWKLSADCQKHSRASEHQQRNRKILTEDLDMSKVCAKMVSKDPTEEKKQRRVTICQEFWRDKTIFGPCHHRWRHTGRPIRSWNEAARCTMEDCQFPTTKIFHQFKSRVKTMLLTFLIVEGLFIMNLYQLDKKSTNFTIWKYWKGCVKKLDGDDPNFFPTMHLLTRHWLWGSF